jgi:hypothetical protein
MKRECTCLGTCRGAAGLGDGWVCALESVPIPVNTLLALKQAALTEIAGGLLAYIEWHGPLHDDDCPEDDTCDCSQKRTNDAVNSAYRLIKAMSESDNQHSR